VTTLQRASALFAVLAAAKLCSAGSLAPEFGPWAPVAYLWQDALVATLFAASGAVVRPRLAWVAYVCISAYTVLNVGVALVLATPLTLPMLRAARGAMSDSIAQSLEPGVLAAMACVAALAALAPRATVRMSPRFARIALVGGLLLIAAGPWALTRGATHGRHRNALVALVSSTRARVTAAAAPLGTDWRRSRPAPESACHPELASRAAGRNVVLVVLESTGAAALAPFGADDDPMPGLSRLARESLLFESAYAVFPESIKELAAVLYSFHPAMDVGPDAYSEMPTASLARVLGAEGYDTALFHSGRFAFLGMQSVVDGADYGLLADAGPIGGRLDSSFGVDEPDTVLAMTRWLDERDQVRPFFLTYLPIAGHHPYSSSSAGPFDAHTEEGAWRNALYDADLALAQLVGALEDRDLWQDTLLVVAGDHGEAFGEHDGNYGHTFFLYEENVHIPLLIVAPGLIAAERRDSRVVSAVDIAPTILGLLGVPAPDGFEGRSLLEPGERAALFVTDYSLALLGMREGRWKLVHEVESGRSMLFDLQRDPGELLDIARSRPDHVREWREHLLGWSAAARARALTY